MKKLQNYSAIRLAAFAVLFSISAINVNAQGGFLNKITDRIDRKKPDGSGRTVDADPTETKNNSASNAYVPSVAPMTVDVLSIQVYTGRRDPSSQTSWKWIPRIDFKINGRRLAVEYTLPGNKPWLTIDCEPESKFDGKILVVRDCGRTTPPEKSSLATGFVNFKILLTNELEGKNQTLFVGRFRVEKFLNNPQFKNEVDFYVDQDWNLPVAYIYAAETRNYLSAESSKSIDFGALETAMWFRDAEKTRQVAGYLFYNGKQIAHTEKTSEGTAGAEFEVNTFNSNAGFLCDFAALREI